MVLRQKHTSSAYTFDTKLRPLFKSLNDGNNMVSQLHNVAVPNLTPIVHLLQRPLEDGHKETFSDSLLSWEALDVNFGLDILLSHLDIARMVAAQAEEYQTSAKKLLQQYKSELGYDENESNDTKSGSGSVNTKRGRESRELEEVCRTEFHLRIMWGSKGVRAPRRERVIKFEQLLGVLSERLEATGDDGTEV